MNNPNLSNPSDPREHRSRLTRRGKLAVGSGLAGAALAGALVSGVPSKAASYLRGQTAKADKLSGPTHAATPDSIDTLPFMQAGPHKEFINDGETASELATRAFPQDTNGRNPEKFAEDVALIASQGFAAKGALEGSQPIELPVDAQIGIEVNHP